LLVDAGGFLGLIARYLLSGLILHRSSGWRFPISTFCVNVVGCFVLGALARLAEKQLLLSADTRLFLFTGLLGDFTTFSAFGAEGVNMIRRGDFTVAATYATLSVGCGFAAVWLGMKLFGIASQPQ
jgi:CrcB protein